MPTESIPLASVSTPTTGPSSTQQMKCSLCGIGNLSSSSSRNDSNTNEGVLLLGENNVERICGTCVRDFENPREILVTDVVIPEVEEVVEEVEEEVDDDPMGIGLGLQGISVGRRGRAGRPRNININHEGRSEDHREETPDSTLSPDVRTGMFSQSLPAAPTKPWNAPIQTNLLSSEAVRSSSNTITSKEEFNRPPNPLLDVTKARIPSSGRGPLYPGSVFRGTQTSGRSAYEVEVKFLDVNFQNSTVSGYLFISHLTDAHPHLTTFFTGEIIGPQYGFITGSKYGATEHDDMRHWGRFEQFRRPSSRADMIRPELLFRDPLPDRNIGEVRGKERDFVFLRIKEKFLVPDHNVRDISGASFAGFYYAMVDFSPPAHIPDIPPTPTSPSIPKSPISPTSPTFYRRSSSSIDPSRSPTRSTVGSGGFGGGPGESPKMKRRESSSRNIHDKEPPREATIRGYYFHSLNQEPFQELFLSHIPNKSSSTMELR